ncbi:MAG: guanylate kinase [Chitinophagaceae bacterium]
MTQSGSVIIITAPSGAGKTSITRYLLQQFPKLRFSVSAATRQQREGEVNGKDYHFMSVAAFNQRINEEAFVEWEMVYEGKYYGTLKSEIQRIWSEGNTPLLDIDVKGAIHVQQQFAANSLSIFIQAPSVDELHKRLESRGTETPQSIQTRISKASYEMSFKDNFDITIINDVLDRAQKETAVVVEDFLAK